MSYLTPEDLAAVYESRHLVDLAVDGHHLFTDTIGATARRVVRQFGHRGRSALYALPPVRQYATGADVARWGRALIEAERALLAPRPPTRPDPIQPEAPFP